MSCHNDHSSSHEFYEIKKEQLGNKGSRKFIEPTKIEVEEKSKNDLVNIHQDILKELNKKKNKFGIDHIAILNKDRSSLYFPCPPKGSIPKELEDMAISLLSPSEPCNVIVIGNTAPFCNHSHPSSAIPFFSLLIGLSYIGHTVIIFEGDKTTMEVFCKDADICIVDEAMIKFLEQDWNETLKGLIKNEEVYVYDRKTCNLNEVF